MRNLKQFLYFIPVAFIFVLLFSVSTSPLYIYEGMDSAIFKLVGLALARGKVLYVDIFDHKGPILFFIQALGQWIQPGKWGIFLLQVLFNTITFTYLYRIIGLFLSGRKKGGLFAVVLLIFAQLLFDGNQCEEWMLMCSVLSSIYTFRYLLKPESGNPISLGLLLGVCFSINFYIRPNDAVAFVGATMFGLFLFQLFIKQYKDAIYSALSFGGGLLLVSIPVFVYFAIHHALYDLYYGCIGFNLMYSAEKQSILMSMLSPVNLIFAGVLTMSSIMLYRSRFRPILWAYIPMSAFAVLLLGGNLYIHYFISYIVLLIPLLALLFANRWFDRTLYIVMAGYVLFVASTVCYARQYPDSVVRNWLHYDFRLRMIVDHEQQIKDFCLECDKVFDMIPLDQRDKVWNYNCGWEHSKQHYHLAMFLRQKMVPVNRILLVKHLGIDPQLKKESDIHIFQPEWLILTHEEDDLYKGLMDDDYQYIEQNYTIAAQTDSSVCDLRLYHRIE